MLVSSILDIVKKIFKTAEFTDQPQKICACVHWALKPDGPAYLPHNPARLIRMIPITS
jgi:hypothetical protein